MKNLIFFDIDGTLVTKKDNRPYAPQSTFDAIKELQAKGNLCFINSGRTLSEIDDYIYTFGMDGFICGCGTYISHKKDELFAHTIPFELGNRILKDLQQCKLEWVLEGKNTLYYSTEKYTTHIGNFQKDHELFFKVPFTTVPYEAAKDLVFDKFCVCLTPDSDMDTFMSHYKDELTFIDRGNDFFEIVPVGHSKASGMQFLMDYFDVPLEHTYAVGDSTNDLPMLEFAGTGIAMKESDAPVLKAAGYITDALLDDGIYNAMKHFKLI